MDRTALDDPSAGPASSQGPARRRAAALLARVAHGHRLGIRARFAIAVATGIVLLAAVGWAGAGALGSTRTSLTHIYEDNVLTTQEISHLGNRLDDAEEAVLYGLVTVTPGQQQVTLNALTTSVLPDIAVALADVTRLVRDSAAQTRLVHELASDWAGFTHQFTSLRFGERKSCRAVRGGGDAEDGARRDDGGRPRAWPPRGAGCGTHIRAIERRLPRGPQPDRRAGRWHPLSRQRCSPCG